MFNLDVLSWPGLAWAGLGWCCFLHQDISYLKCKTADWPVDTVGHCGTLWDTGRTEKARGVFQSPTQSSAG